MAARVKPHLVHPSADDCPDPECEICALRDCPFKEPLHYHHDGCPICSQAHQIIYAAIIGTVSVRVRERWVENMADNVLTALAKEGMIGYARKEEVAKGRAR